MNTSSFMLQLQSRRWSRFFFIVLITILNLIVEMEAFSSGMRAQKRWMRPRSTVVLFKSRIERVGPPPPDMEDPIPEPIIIEEETEPDMEIPVMSLDELLKPSTMCNVNQMGPTALAYIGDVVFELFVRSRFVWPTRRTADLQQKVVSLVRAEYQSQLLKQLLESFDLTNDERQIIARGRNSSTVSSKNRRNASAYQDATALEALVGYLYITNQARLEEVLNWIYVHLDTDD